METEKKEVTATGEEKRITLELNTEGGGSACFFCGQFVEFGGLDFFIKGTKEFRVCLDCVKQKAPDLYLIWRDAHRWRENFTEEAWHNGLAEGKREAGKIILAAIEEKPIDRIKHLCLHELGAQHKLGTQDDVPF